MARRKLPDFRRPAQPSAFARRRVDHARGVYFLDARAPRALPFPADPLPRFSRRRKEWPTPVLCSERRRRVLGGDHSPLPREPALGQLAGHAIVKAVVRRLADRNEIPCAPLPTWEVLDWVDMMHGRCQLSAAVARSVAAVILVAPQHCIAQMQPALALVVHGKTKSAQTSQRRPWRSCHPAITSAAKQKRQTIYRLRGRIIWRWL